MIEVELPDGSIAEFPDGTTNDVMQSAIRKRLAAPQGQHLTFEEGQKRLAEEERAERMAGYTGKAGAALSSVVDGVPVVGPYLLEGAQRGAAALAGAFGADNASVEEARAITDQAQAEHPYTTTAGNIAGAVGGTLPLVAAMPGVMGASGGLAARTIASSLSGATLGGADAAVRSGGDIKDTMKGAAWGGGLGFVAPAAGMAIGKAASPVANLFRNPSSGQSALGRAAAADGVDDIAGRLASMGDDAMVMDLGPNLQRQAGALASQPGEAQQAVRSAIAQRQAGAGARVVGALDDALGQPVNTLAMADDIVARRAAAARPLYDAAYAKPVPYTKELEDLLKRPMMAKALKSAQTLAADEGIASPQWFANVADDGTVTIRNVPDVRQLDLTKRALDDVISGAQRAGNNNAARIYQQQKDLLVGMVDKAVPEYAAARKAFSGPSAVLDALEEGGSIFTRKMTPNEMRTRLLKMDDGQKEAFIQGGRAAVADIMGTARNDALAARNLFSQGYNKEKLALLVGKDQADKMLKALDAETTFMRTRDIVTGNPETAARLAAQDDIAARGGDGVFRSIANMKFGDAAASALDGLTRRATTAMQQQSNAELARLLTATSLNTQEATRAIKLLQEAARRGDIAAEHATRLIQTLPVVGAQQR